MRIYKIESVETRINEITGKQIPDHSWVGDLEVVCQDHDNVYCKNVVNNMAPVPYVTGYSKKDFRFFDGDLKEIKFE